MRMDMVKGSESRKVSEDEEEQVCGLDGALVL